MWLDGISYISWNGENSIDYKIAVQKLPVFQVPEEKFETIEISGKDGTLYRTEDAYRAYQTTCEMTMLDDRMRDDVFNWLRGSGTLRTSDDEDHSVRARVVSKIEPARIVPLVRSFIVTFECQPFRYEAVPETIALSVSGNLYHPGTRDSLPIITVYGTSGTITINGVAITLSGIDSYLTINSEIQEVYKGTVNEAAKMSGEFPVLVPGLNTIALSGVTVLIVPQWRWF